MISDMRITAGSSPQVVAEYPNLILTWTLHPNGRPGFDAMGNSVIFQGSAATLVANILFAMAQFLLERQVPMGFFLGRVLIPSLIINTLLAAPLYLVVRLGLRGAGDLRAARAR